ncbi:hypothetical protein GGR53DRAFT_464345 [Hypoxylon sp. FL1150]|nr:hypothetical protein GGR53DRAFT_464345 [Hypoxylon sp. FL1150]
MDHVSRLCATTPPALILGLSSVTTSLSHLLSLFGRALPCSVPQVSALAFRAAPQLVSLQGRGLGIPGAPASKAFCYVALRLVGYDITHSLTPAGLKETRSKIAQRHIPVPRAGLKAYGLV